MKTKKQALLWGATFTAAVTAGVAAYGLAPRNSASAAAHAAAHNKTITLAESGSSLLYPLFNGEWIPAYEKLYPNVHITAAATGSGTGIAQAIAGTVQIGASDAYMADAQMKQNPTMVNIPLAISAQQVMYHLPGLKKGVHLHLNGPVLAQIYEGKIVYWNDAKIARLNPGLKLPHARIVPVRRSDNSGDTFLFTQYLSDTDAKWKQTVGFGTSVSWPAVSGSLGAKGNDGVVQTLAQTPYTIGYVGISWLDKAVQAGLGYAALQNKAGQFVLPNKHTIAAAANQMASHTPADERISLIDAPGKDSYPIINYEYAIVNTKQPADVAQALKRFLNWAIDPKWGGNKPSFLNPVHFLPLPPSIKPLSQHQIAKIGQ